MKFEVYCDESCPDLLSSANPQAKYVVIGGLWLKGEIRESLKMAIHELRDRYKVGPEFKWHRVTPSRVDFYVEIIHLFFAFASSEFSFRSIVINAKKVDLKGHHEGDHELGFYTFYYHLLKQWIFPGHEYAIFCDKKSNRVPTRLKTLERRLRATRSKAEISKIQAVDSSDSVLIQLADVLIGATSARLNRAVKPGSAKEQVIKTIEQALERPIQPTFLYEQKYNVYKIRLSDRAKCNENPQPVVEAEE